MNALKIAQHQRCGSFCDKTICPGFFLGVLFFFLRAKVGITSGYLPRSRDFSRAFNTFWARNGFRVLCDPVSKVPSDQ